MSGDGQTRTTRRGEEKPYLSSAADHGRNHRPQMAAAVRAMMHQPSRGASIGRGGLGLARDVDPGPWTAKKEARSGTAIPSRARIIRTGTRVYKVRTLYRPTAQDATLAVRTRPRRSAAEPENVHPAIR
jgi:hypothetical protein